MIKRAALTTVTVRREGARVLILHDGRLLADLEYQAALALAAAIHAQAKKAEEEARALDIAADQALLLRLGIPLGLSSRKDILAQAVNEAAWNTDLRRACPGGVRSQAVFGTPTIRKKRSRP
jgi:hypothetical protein